MEYMREYTCLYWEGEEGSAPILKVIAREKKMNCFCDVDRLGANHNIPQVHSPLPNPLIRLS